MTVVYFVKNPTAKSSNVVCADEMSKLLKNHGIQSSSIKWSTYRRHFSKNDTDVFIFIKPDRGKPKKIGNRYSIIDTVDVRQLDQYKNTDHLVLVRTKERCYRLKEEIEKIDYVYHSVSREFRIRTRNSRRLRVRYFGTLDLNNMPVLIWSFIRCSEMRPRRRPFTKCPYEDELKKTNMHVNLRNTPWKPTNKITQAAYSFSNILINPEAGGVEELLGPDYPYMCELNAKAIRDMLGFAKRTFGGKVWKKGLQRMRQARSLTCEREIAKGYVRVISRLGVDL